jgi:hypothetical protein
MSNWNNFDRQLKARHQDFNRDFAQTRRSIKWWSIVSAIFAVIGGTLVLGILALVLLELARGAGIL